MHGGSAPQVQRTARQRLQELVEPAIQGLRAALESGDLGAIIKAARIVLDRTGYTPTSRVEIIAEAREQLLASERQVLFQALDELRPMEGPLLADEFIDLLYAKLIGAEPHERSELGASKEIGC